ncbi:MAG: hypothetical protein WA323_24325 [Candidatus Nitrosopolaris sp.]
MELTNLEIEEIRKLHNAGKRHRWIAHKYGLRKKKLVLSLGALHLRM